MSHLPDGEHGLAVALKAVVRSLYLAVDLTFDASVLADIPPPPPPRNMQTFPFD